MVNDEEIIERVVSCKTLRYLVDPLEYLKPPFDVNTVHEKYEEDKERSTAISYDRLR